jgi:hypothetical protein
MNATPQTDRQTGWAIANQYGQSTSRELLADSKGIFVHAVFARQLETELIKMTTRAEKAEAELAVSESERMEQARLLGKSGSREAALLTRLRADGQARAEHAEADTARLDWLSVFHVWFDIPASGTFTPETLRAAIDAAMKEASK